MRKLLLALLVNISTVAIAQTFQDSTAIIVTIPATDSTEQVVKIIRFKTLYESSVGNPLDSLININSDRKRATISPYQLPISTAQAALNSTYATATSSTAFSNKTGNISQWTNNSGYLVAADIAGKQNTITTGTTAQYFRGDLSLFTFPTTTAAFVNSTDKNFVSDAKLTVVNNTTGTNSGDNATNTQYSGLAASKQDVNSNLTTIAGLTPTTDNFMVATSSAWASRTPTQARSQLGGTNVGQNLFTATDPGAITFLQVNADNTINFQSSGSQRTALGLAIGTNVQAYDPDLTTWAGLSPTTVGQNIVTLTNPGAITFLKMNADNTVTARSAANYKIDLSLTIGTDVQAYDADLSIYGGITPSSNVQTLLGSADYSAFKNSLSLNLVTNESKSTMFTNSVFTGTFTAPNATITNGMLAGSIAATKLIGTDIATLGTVTTGTWNGTIIGTLYGGTGVDNSTGGTSNQFWARPNGATGAATYRAIVAADIPTLNQSTTGSAGSLKSVANTGLLTVTGMGAGTTRAKTVRDADDTFLELGGSYTPTGTWTNMVLATPNIGAATGSSFAATGAVTSSGTAGIGYATGAGGTVTQATSKSTGVTLNKISGDITLNNAALAAATIVSFTLTNSTIAATDQILVQHQTTRTFGAYTITGRTANGSAVISIRNNTAGSLGEAIVIKFTVIKSVTN